MGFAVILICIVFGWIPEERPRHRVAVDGFWMGHLGFRCLVRPAPAPTTT